MILMQVNVAWYFGAYVSIFTSESSAFLFIITFYKFRVNLKDGSLEIKLLNQLGKFPGYQQAFLAS